MSEEYKTVVIYKKMYTEKEVKAACEKAKAEGYIEGFVRGEAHDRIKRLLKERDIK